MNKRYQTLIGLTVVSLLSACSSTDKANDLALLKAQQQQQVEFNQCKSHVLDMDHSARNNKSLAQYLTSATAAQGCLREVDFANPLISDQQKMQLHALTVLNFVKGGDITKARSSLDVFVTSYAGKDLFFDDNTSFVDTFTVLLKEGETKSTGLNVNSALMTELKRKNTWLNR